MSRNFPVRTGVTGVRCCGGPLYRTADLCGLTVGGSAGYLSSLIAPSRAERCAGCCSTIRTANKVSTPAPKHRENAIKNRKVTKAERRRFLVFMSGECGKANYKPIIVFHRFPQPLGCIILRHLRQNFSFQI